MNAKAVSAVLIFAGVISAASSAERTSSQSPGPVMWTAEDSALKWGPCPPFLPQGCQIAVLNGEPAKPNADVFFKVPGKSKLPMHWHSSAERMVLVAGELHVTYEGQKTVVLKPGSYAYGPPKHHHSGECVSATPCVLFIAFESPVDAVATQ